MFTSTTFIFLLVTVWTVSAEVGLGCRQGWTLAEGYCFYVGRGTIDSSAADSKCMDMLTYPAASWRVGAIKSELEKKTSSGVRGAWVNNEVWYDVYEDNFLNTKNCTFLDAEKDWQSGVLPCFTQNEEMLYVCEELPSITDCFGSSCYILTDDRHNNPCNYEGGHLARIESLEENQFVAEFLENASSVEVHLYQDYRFGSAIYIDGNDNAKEGQWVFSNGDKMTYWNWADGEPNNHNDGEDCIAIRPGTYDWNDLSCYETIHHLCEDDKIDTL